MHKCIICGKEVETILVLEDTEVDRNDPNFISLPLHEQQEYGYVATHQCIDCIRQNEGFGE